MAYVAVTAGFFALGSYLGRTLSEAWAIVWFIAGFGAAGYATRRDLSGLARLSFWALVALILFAIDRLKPPGCPLNFPPRYWMTESRPFKLGLRSDRQ